jgi:hypothetical protein
MRLTKQILFNVAKRIGVKVEIIEHPDVLMTEFIVIGESKKRKEMIDFIEDFRYVGFVFKYVEREFKINGL